MKEFLIGYLVVIYALGLGYYGYDAFNDLFVRRQRVHWATVFGFLLSPITMPINFGEELRLLKGKP